MEIMWVSISEAAGLSMPARKKQELRSAAILIELRSAQEDIGKGYNNKDPLSFQRVFVKDKRKWLLYDIFQRKSVLECVGIFQCSDGDGLQRFPCKECLMRCDHDIWE